MSMRTGTWRIKLRYFLTDLGDHKIILGYPWFVTAQPKIDWARGWIDHAQLLIILRAKDAAMAQFSTRMTKSPPMRIRKGEVERLTREQVPPQYQWYLKVFSD